MSTAVALSEQEIIEARAELAEDAPVTVWFTAAAVSVPAGKSARLVAVGEQTEGEFLQVRPAGSRDEVFCSPLELTRSRPSRRKEPAEPPPAPVRRPRPRREPAAVAARSEAPTTAVVVPEEPSAAPPRPRKAKERPSPEVTVTVASGADGEWSVTVVQGHKTVVRPTPVAPAEVAKAARCLPAAVGQAVDASLAAARSRQLERVAALRSQLEAAEQALQDLGG